MKKILLITCLIFLCISLPAHAGWVTISFDEIPAWNTEPPYIGEQYAASGVHFSPAMGPADGAIYSGGTRGITGTNGAQFLGFDGAKYQKKSLVYGTYMAFDMDIPEFSFDYAWGALVKKNVKPLKKTQWVNYTMFYDGEVVDEGKFKLPKNPNTWLTFDYDTETIDAMLIYTVTNKKGFVSKGLLAMDNLMVDPEITSGAPPVPVPASLLLFASGLIPLLRLRRKK